MVIFTLDMSMRKLIIFWFAISAVILFPLFTGKIFSYVDAVTYMYPYASLFSDCAQCLWNPYINLGIPKTASFIFGYYQPLYHIFYGLFSYLDGFHLIVFANVILAAIFSYLFVVGIPFKRREAFFASLIYTFNSFNLYWMSSIHITFTFWILPALFLCIDKIINNNKKYLILTSVSLGLGWLGGHYQWLFFTIIAGLFYLLARLGFIYRDGVRDAVARTWLFQKIWQFVLAILGSLIIGFPQLLNTFYFTGVSTRSGGLPIWGDNNIVSAGESLLSVIGLILPQVSLPHINSMHAYLGITGLLMAYLAFLNCRRGGDIRRLIFIFLGGFFFLASFTYSPFYFLIYYIPPMMFFREPSRILFIANFFLAIIAAYGLSDLLSNYQKNKAKLSKLSGYLLFFLFAIFLIGTLFTFLQPSVLNFLTGYFDIHLYRNTSGLPLSYYHKVIAGQLGSILDQINFRSIQLQIALLSCAALYFVFKMREIKIRFLYSMIIAITLLNLISANYIINGFFSAKLIRTPPRSAVAILNREQDLWKYRTISYLVSYIAYNKIIAINPTETEANYTVLKEGLMPNFNIYYKIPIIRGFEPMEISKNQRLIESLFENENKRMPVEEKIKDFIDNKIPVLSLLNTKYIISPFELKNNNLSLLDHYNITKFDVPIFIYENKDARPKVYVSIAPQCYSDEEELFKTMINRKSGDKTDAYILNADCDAARPSEDRGIVDKFKIEHDNDDFVRITTNFDRTAWIIFSESNVPGWTARVDSQDVKVYSANYVFQAVRVAAGRHVTEFRYVGVMRKLLF